MMASICYYHINRELLKVDIAADRSDIALQAATICEEIISNNANINVSMVHEPTKAQLNHLADRFYGSDKKIVLIGGQMMLMHCLIPLLKGKGYTVVEAITERVAQETTLPDGKVVKKSVFQHKGLREY